MAVNPNINFGLEKLPVFYMYQVNALFANEIKRITKRCNQYECSVCDKSSYCEWLHLAQLQVLKMINQVTTSQGGSSSPAT